MIYIKTDMKEMPKGCGECPRTQETIYGKLYCIDGKYFETGNQELLPAVRPDWCPLVEKEDL